MRGARALALRDEVRERPGGVQLPAFLTGREGTFALYSEFEFARAAEPAPLVGVGDRVDRQSTLLYTVLNLHFGAR